MTETAATAVPGLIGSSAPMVRLRAAIAPAAASDEPAFLIGESGTGKDIVAQAIHAASGRGPEAFVTLNASAVPDDILDRELWGLPAPGGAQPYPAVPRYLAEAQGGTLYVDDICRASPQMQARLLHLMQSGTVVGADGKARPFGARIIAATNTEIADCLRNGRVRRDLYDSLATIVIELPPLRSRSGDAGEIAAQLYPGLLQRFGLPAGTLSAATLARINSLPWPGNVRQLLNVLRRMALAPQGPGGHGPELPADVLREPAAQRDDPAPQGGSFAEIERRAILDAIGRHGGSVQKAAEELRVAASTIYRKLKGWQDG